MKISSMSLSLHLAVLENQESVSCVMPLVATRPNSKINILPGGNLGNSKGLHSNGPHCNGLHAMKEYSLISHIESLKAVASGNIPFIKPNDGGGGDGAIDTTLSKSITPSSCQAGFQPYISLSHLTDKLESLNTQTNPVLSKWATDPDSVPGNLRRDSAGKPISISLEEIISCSSSSIAKRNDNEEDEDYDDEDTSSKKLNLKHKRKSAKSKRKSQQKIKDPNKSLSISGKEARCSIPSTHHVLKNNETKISLRCSPLGDIASLTALCKGMKIQEKQSNSICVKQVPYSRKTSTSNASPNKNQSPFRASVEHAMAEYTKKSHVSVSHSHSTNYRKKVHDDEMIRTTKVYLSEKQSGILSDCGTSFPCAPPATPTADQLRRYEYVPSLQDIRSQRSFRQRLQMMESRATRKEQKKQADCMKQERMSMRERRIEMKKKQRLEIYALNKIMTDLENERFRQFMQSTGSNL